jgi:hypothetical protein
MPRLPRVSGAETIRALERLGFTQARQCGSHVVIKRTGRDGVWLCRSVAYGTRARHVTRCLEASRS